jgi:PAS domain S-box-containing protein
MTTQAKGNAPGKSANLRWRAEEAALREAPGTARKPEAMPPEALRRTVHELQVHQIELEMQNEELGRVQAELERARARYFDLYDLAPVGYFILSTEGLILEANLAGAELLGSTRGTLVGKPISRFILQQDQDIYYLKRKQFLRTGEPYACDLRLARQDGTASWVHLAAVPAQVPSADPGTGGGAAQVNRVVLSDISERMQVQAALQRQASLLRRTQQLARLGSWEWDVQAQTMSWEEEIYRLLECRPGRRNAGRETLERTLECYLPEDRPVLQAAFRSCVEEGTPYDLKFRITTAKGRQRWVRTLAEPVLENGKVVRVVGFMMDLRSSVA